MSRLCEAHVATPAITGGAYTITSREHCYAFVIHIMVLNHNEFMITANAAKLLLHQEHTEKHATQKPFATHDSPG